MFRIRYIIFLFASLPTLVESQMQSNLSMPINQARRSDFSIHSGMSIFNNPFYSGSAYFVNPGFSYKLSPKLYTHTSLGYTRLNLNRKTESFSLSSPDIYSLRTSLGYQMNQNLILYGSYTLSKGNTVSMNPQALNYNYSNTSLGFIYKVNENISFGAEFRQYKGYQFSHPMQFLEMDPMGFKPNMW